MRSSVLLLVTALTSVLAVPQTPPAGSLALGAECTSSDQCSNGVNCYSTNSGLIRRCGNFQAACSSDSQCAYNTCREGLCNGFIASASSMASNAASTPTAPAATSTPTSTAGELPLGANCSPDSTPCANGAQCYATNFMLQTRCGNFQSACTSDAQCAFNTCNQGLCNGFIASASSMAPNAASTSGPSVTYSGVAPGNSTTAGVAPRPGGNDSTPTGGASNPNASTPPDVNTSAAMANKMGVWGLAVAGVVTLFFLV